jgi:hypothetical protein
MRAILLLLVLIAVAPGCWGSCGAAGHRDLATREQNMNPYYVFIAALFGAVVGSLATHGFTLARDRRNRRGAFLGYLLMWRSNIAREAPHDKERVWQAYLHGVHAYHLELGKITEDYLKNAQFGKVTDSLGNLQREAVLTAVGDVRAPICTPIDELRGMLHGM